MGVYRRMKFMPPLEKMVATPLVKFVIVLYFGGWGGDVDKVYSMSVIASIHTL